MRLNNLRNRRGKFLIPDHSRVDRLLRGFQGMIPIRVEHLFDRECFEMVMVSEELPEVPLNVKTPCYEITLSETLSEETGKTTYQRVITEVTQW